VQKLSDFVKPQYYCKSGDYNTTMLASW